MKFKIIFGFAVIFLSFLIFLPVSRAATLYFAPDSVTAGVGGEFKVDLKIDTQNVSINAAQATIKFSPNVVKVLNFDKSSSVFNFWLEEPVFSNDDGTLRFIAGTAKGISGSALQVISLRFKTVGAGKTQITATDAAITASDGSGTNVLSAVKSANVGVEIEVLAPSTPSVEVPQRVTRPAVPARGLPEKPKIRVPLYPDQPRWYSQVGNVIALWDLPQDVIQISARLTQGMETKIGEPEKELFNGKDFGIIKEGIWYVRVQFKNNVGWGEAAYYKISLDTTAPLPFNIKIDSVASDNPSPKIRFETNDSLSGISEYAILIGGKEILRTASSSLVLPPQFPGQHKLTIRALDLAGNSVEDNLPFDILPLELPVINFVSPSIIGGEQIFISGKSSPMAYVEIHLNDEDKKEVFSEKVKTDELGNWELRIEEFFPQGIYSAYAVARDDRGASSYPTDSWRIKIIAKPVFFIGTIDFGWFEIFLIGLVLVLAGGGFYWRRYSLSKERRAAYSIIAMRDFQNFIKLLENDFDKIEELRKRGGFEEKCRVELGFASDKIKNTIEKMKKYLTEEFKKIK